MKRREFIAFVGSVAAYPLKLHSQQPQSMRRIGYLTPTVRFERFEEVFERSLETLGWLRNRNIHIQYWYTVRRESIASIVSQISALGLDVLVSWSPGFAVEITQAVPQTAAVFLTTDLDPIEAGVVSSIAHPGGRITGIINGTNQLPDKRLQLLKQALPTLARAAVLLPTDRANSGLAFQRLTAAARLLDVTLIEIEAAVPSEIEAAMRQARERGAQAVYVWLSGFAFSFAKQIADAANANGIPCVQPYLDYIDGASACLFALAADFKEQNRRAAAYVDKILRGSEPSSLPVEQMSKYELIVNLKIAKSLGLTIPSALLARADEIIE